MYINIIIIIWASKGIFCHIFLSWSASVWQLGWFIERVCIKFNTTICRYYGYHPRGGDNVINSVLCIFCVDFYVSIIKLWIIVSIPLTWPPIKWSKIICYLSYFVHHRGKQNDIITFFIVIYIWVIYTLINFRVTIYFYTCHMNF